METQILQEKGSETKGVLIFAGVTAAAFLVLMYGSLFKGIPMGLNVLLFIAIMYASMLASFSGRFWRAMRGSFFQTGTVVLLGVSVFTVNNLILLSINGFLIAVLVGAQYRFMLTGRKDALFSQETVGDASVVWLGYTCRSEGRVWEHEQPGQGEACGRCSDRYCGDRSRIGCDHRAL